jgi:hypothetical protein
MSKAKYPEMFVDWNLVIQWLTQFWILSVAPCCGCNWTIASVRGQCECYKEVQGMNVHVQNLSCTHTRNQDDWRTLPPQLIYRARIKKNFDFQCHAVVLCTNWSKPSAKHNIHMWRKFMTWYWTNSYTN